MTMPLRVVVIVEGHGEDGAIRTLLERIWYELLGGDYIEVISSIASRSAGPANPCRIFAARAKRGDLCK